MSRVYYKSYKFGDFAERINEISATQLFELAGVPAYSGVLLYINLSDDIWLAAKQSKEKEIGT